ncbi:MAG: hypothetical protein MRZ79_22550 [Bacteroidia bacterium]|nr:hypothetical protein [Bacteroidia bacterium]
MNSFVERLATLKKFFNLEELREMSVKMGIDHEEIDGKTKSAFARELILAVERRERIPELDTLVNYSLENLGIIPLNNTLKEIPQELINDSTQKIREAISKNKLQEAVKELHALSKEGFVDKNSLAILQNRFTRFEEDLSKGILSFENAEVLKNTILNDILSLIPQ